MRKLVLGIIGLMFVVSSFAQMGMGKAGIANEDLTQIKELKSSVLHVYIERGTIVDQKNVDNNKVTTGELYRQVIKKYWNFCKIKFITKEEYKELSKDKSIFFLSNTLKGKAENTSPSQMSPNNPRSSQNGGTGMSMSNPMEPGYLILSKGKPGKKRIMKNSAIFAMPFTDLSRLRLKEDKKNLAVFDIAKEKMVIDVMTINNYLKDCITYNTGELVKVAQKNAPSLKDEKVIFLNPFVKFKEEDLSDIKNFDPTILSVKEAQLYYQDMVENKYLILRPLIMPVAILTNEYNKLCFVYIPKSPIKYKVPFKELQKLDKNIGQ